MNSRSVCPTELISGLVYMPVEISLIGLPVHFAVGDQGGRETPLVVTRTGQSRITHSIAHHVDDMDVSQWR